MGVKAKHWRNEGEGPGTLEIQRVVSTVVRREAQLTRLVAPYVRQCSHELTGHPATCMCQRVIHDVFYELCNPPGKQPAVRNVSVHRGRLASETRRNKIIHAVYGERPGVDTFHERSGLFPWFSVFRYPHATNWDSAELLVQLYQFLAMLATASESVGDRGLVSLIIRLQSAIEAVQIAHEEGIDLERRRANDATR